MKFCSSTLFSLCFLLLTMVSFSQTNYQRGFKAGYINASCFEKTENCNINVPVVKGNTGKFSSGYSYGFEEGLKDRKDGIGKKYLKDYYQFSNELKNFIYSNNNGNKSLANAFEKIKELYLIGDYDRCIVLCELLETRLDDDYIIKMYKGFSLIELEEFKQGKKFVTWASQQAKDPDLKSKLDDVIKEVEAGTRKNNRKIDNATITTKNGITNSKSTNTVSTTPIKPATRVETEKSREIGIADTGTKSYDANYKSGWDKYKAGDYPAAIADLTKAIAINAPLKAYHLRALAKEKMDDIYGAEKDLAYITRQNAEKNNVDYVEAVQQYGSLLIRLKKYEQALREMDTLIVKNTMALPIAHYNRGLAKVNLNDKEGGCLDLSTAGELGYKEAYEAIKTLCK